jgi:type I restriction enzyme S subunit
MPFVTGAVQPKLNQANMNRIPMIIPDEKILTRFDEVLSVFFGMILENESQIKNLEVSRDSLLPRLMGGKIRANKTI